MDRGHGFAWHYVLLVGVEDDAFLVKDPARGRSVYSCRATRSIVPAERVPMRISWLVLLNGPTPVIPVPGIPPKIRLAKSAASVEDSARGWNTSSPGHAVWRGARKPWWGHNTDRRYTRFAYLCASRFVYCEGVWCYQKY